MANGYSTINLLIDEVDALPWRERAQVIDALPEHVARMFHGGWDIRIKARVALKTLAHPEKEAICFALQWALARG